MNMQAGAARSCVAAAALLLGACATPVPYDYANFRAHPPRSILVLPPLNESTDVSGTYTYLSTVTQPLAELGYYVFPVAVVDQYLRENGMPTAGDMHQITPAKLGEVIGADAVLYLDLQQYGSKYQLISSNTTVEVKARLVDSHSGQLLWDNHALAQNSSNSNSGGLLGQLLAAALSQVVNSKTDAAHGVCRMANAQLFATQGRELPYGPYSPNFLKNPAGASR
jgi:hypothetical protein